MKCYGNPSLKIFLFYFFQCFSVIVSIMLQNKTNIFFVYLTDCLSLHGRLYLKRYTSSVESATCNFESFCFPTNVYFDFLIDANKRNKINLLYFDNV